MLTFYRDTFASQAANDQPIYDMQHELGQFNVELNIAPRRLSGRVLRDSESDLTGVFDQCRARIEGLGVRMVTVGTLPTLSAEQLTVERISHNPRYELLARRMP